MIRDKQHFILTTPKEIDILHSGIEREPGGRVSSCLEDKLIHAIRTSTLSPNGTVQMIARPHADFYFDRDVADEAKEALENVIAQDGLKGLIFQARGRKKLARSILEELARAEEFAA